jgi:SAM-dependent methyltransferase
VSDEQLTSEAIPLLQAEPMSSTTSGSRAYVPPDALDRIAELTESLQRQARKRLSLTAGSRVLDVGCGTGGDTLAMARDIAPGGTAIGIDLDPTMIKLAQQAAVEAGLHRQVRFMNADARALPFDDNTFDACWSERLLQHLEDPGATLNQMIRVTRSGGQVSVAEADWHTLSVHHHDTALERSFVAAVSTVALSPSAGRDLYWLFRQRGLINPVVEVFPIWWTDGPTFLATSLSVVDLADRIGEQFAGFLEDLRTPPEGEAFFAHANLVLISATKP